MSKQINLYSPLFRKQTKLFTAQAMVQALAFIAVMLAIFYGYARYQTAAFERQAAEVDRRLKSAMQQLQAVPGGPIDLTDEKAVDARIAELQAKLGANEQLMEQTGGPARSDYLDPLRALARQRLEGVWLTSVQLAGEDGELSIAGRALNAALVPQYIQKLGQDDALQGREFSTLSIEREKKTDKAPASGTVDFRLLAPAGEGG